MAVELEILAPVGALACLRLAGLEGAVRVAPEVMAATIARGGRRGQHPQGHVGPVAAAVAAVVPHGLQNARLAAAVAAGGGAVWEAQPHLATPAAQALQ